MAGRDSAAPFSLQNDTVAQLASRYPAGPLLTHPSAAAFARTSDALFPPSIGESTPTASASVVMTRGSRSDRVLVVASAPC